MGAEIGIMENQERYMPTVFNFDLIRTIKTNDNIEFRNVLNRLDTKNMKLHDARDYRGASLLHVAAECGNTELVKYLVTVGFDVDFQDEHGQTALIFALKNNHFASAKVLLELNADYRICDTLGICALQIVIAADPMTSVNSDIPSHWLSQYFEVVTFILEKINDDCLSNSKKIADRLLRIRCPITHVVFMKNSEVMEIMIRKGCPINVRDRLFGKTALHLAVQSWKVDKVKILLDCGANVHILDYNKNTPSMCIYKNMKDFHEIPPCEIEMVKILLQHKHKFLAVNNQGPCFVDQMSQIFSKGSKDAVRVVVEESDDDLFLAKNKDQFTLLHLLAENPDPGMIEIIKGRKVDLNGKSRYGESALGHAMHFDNYEMIDYLLSEGASTDFENADRDTLRRSFMTDVHAHDIRESYHCTKLLLEYGVDQEVMVINQDNTLSLLDVALEHQEFLPLVQPILAQFAIRQSLGVYISELFRKRIQLHNEKKTHFDMCINQLEEAKILKIFKSVSIFELLTASDKMISRCARDKILVSNLSQSIDRLNLLDPYYMELLHKRYEKILLIAESREKAEGVISQHIGIFYEYNSLVTRIIVDYLSDKDVKKLL